VDVVGKAQRRRRGELGVSVADKEWIETVTGEKTKTTRRPFRRRRA